MTETTKLTHRQEQMIAATMQIDPHALWYHVKMRPVEARAFFAAIDNSDINRIPALTLVPLIAAIDAAVPPMDYGESNQNTGRDHHFYLVGREGSRVLYFCTMRSYLPRDFDFDELEMKMKMWGGMYAADEAWTVPFPDTPNPHFWFCFRFWWD